MAMRIARWGPGPAVGTSTSSRPERAAAYGRHATREGRDRAERLCNRVLVWDRCQWMLTRRIEGLATDSQGEGNDGVYIGAYHAQTISAES